MLFYTELRGEMIFDFGRISKSLSNFSLGFNGTLMQTKVTLADKIINPINGQLLDNIEKIYKKDKKKLTRRFRTG